MSDFVWNFPLSQHATQVGYNGLGTDDFKDSPIENMTREAIQNSLDARAGDAPVTVEFVQFDTDIDCFLGKESFFQTLIKWRNSLHSNPQGADKREVALVESALKTFAYASSGKEKLHWLRISDFHTNGMQDVKNEKGPWQAFVKGIGQSRKSDSSGGSKGLGRNAIVVNSLLNTIFVNTNSCFNGINEKASTGIAKFCSFKDNDANDYTIGQGFCVENNDEAKKFNESIYENLYIDPDFSRQEGQYGTDIYVPGFANALNLWEKEASSKAILSFLPAIIGGKLEIKISGKNQNIEISKNNIFEKIQDSGLFSSNKNFRIANLYFKALYGRKPDFTYRAKPGFDMDLYVIKENNKFGSTNDVLIYRYPTEMSINSIKINSFGPYSAVLLLKGDELCKRLRAIEDVKHETWSINRCRDTEFSRDQVKEALDTYKAFLNEKLNNFGLDIQSTDIDFEWAKENGLSENGEEFEEELKDVDDSGLSSRQVVFEKKAITKIRKPHKKRGTVKDDTTEADATTWMKGLGEYVGEGDDGSHPDGHNSGHGGDPHPGSETIGVAEGNEKMMIRKNISTARAIMPSRNPQKGEFTLIFTPRRSGKNAEIDLKKSGANNVDEDASIVSAVMDGKQLTVFNGKTIKLGDIEKDKTYSIDLILNEKMNFVWEVDLSADE